MSCSGSTWWLYWWWVQWQLALTTVPKLCPHKGWVIELVCQVHCSIVGSSNNKGCTVKCTQQLLQAMCTGEEISVAKLVDNSPTV